MTEAERHRLQEVREDKQPWYRWGPYLSERQWGTVREDYSPNGEAWDFLTHDQARSHTYRWGEDGLMGISDDQQQLCFALALWNGADSILKERLFGLTNSEGNHGEDVKEYYYFLDNTPTHSYMKALYKYPQSAFPYTDLVATNRHRGRYELEYELMDTGIFAENRSFDVTMEYAKVNPLDILIRVSATNRGPEAATLHLLPTLWFRNTWAWGTDSRRPVLSAVEPTGEENVRLVQVQHQELGDSWLACEGTPELLFTENESNAQRLWSTENRTPFVKDGFHETIVDGARDKVNPQGTGTKAAAHYSLIVEPGATQTILLRLSPSRQSDPFAGAAEVFATRIREANDFYRAVSTAKTEDERAVQRQALAGLLWSKQFYSYDVDTWLMGDPAGPPPPPQRSRNKGWRHLSNFDVILMPDTWEYPWYAAWDLAFHCIAMALIDSEFAKNQLLLMLHERYMHPSGQLPAYEWAFSDVNPPVHAWSAWRVYKMTGPRGGRDRLFLSRLFQKLCLNFTWWVNRKDSEGNHLFGGGFLGLDNVGVFDRSRPLPGGGTLEQADGTAWMGFYCVTLLEMALELAREDPACEDMASKFFEHFVAIADAMNAFGGSGLWCPDDGFYYDQLLTNGRVVPLRVRSMVGLIPLLACTVLDEEALDRFPGFAKRMRWFLDNRPDLARHIAWAETGRGRRLLAIPSRERLERVLRYMLDENELLSPHGIRSLSRVHRERPFVLRMDGQEYEVHYTPAESDSGLFGGNSNWRGPVWFPLNYLLAEALERYHHFYGDDLRVECPTGSGRLMNLHEVAQELYRRLAGLFVPDADGRRPCQGHDPRFRDDPHWRDLITFAEFFCGDTGRGIGARYQGWTTLAIRCFEDLARSRSK